MKKFIIITSLTLTVSFFTWQTLLIMNGMGSFNGKDNQSLSPNKKDKFTMDSIRVAHFTKKGKSPFVAYKIKPKPKVVKKKKKVIKRKPKIQAKPPRIKITGIMWNPTSPIAMITLPNGTSTTARAGQFLEGNIEVKKIEKHRIQVIYKDNSFWIKK